MSDAYIEQRDGVYVVAGIRVSLDSIVYAFMSGQSAEAIAQAFPVLNLERGFVPSLRTQTAKLCPPRARPAGSVRGPSCA